MRLLVPCSELLLHRQTRLHPIGLALIHEDPTRGVAVLQPLPPHVLLRHHVPPLCPVGLQGRGTYARQVHCTTREASPELESVPSPLSHCGEFCDCRGTHGSCLQSTSLQQCLPL